MAKRASRTHRSGRDAARARMADLSTQRLERRAAVMRVFTARPGELLDADQVGEATGLPADQAKNVIAALEGDRWLQRGGYNDLGHPAWRRTADPEAGDAFPAAPVNGQASAPGALRPGRRQFFCRGCRGGTVATDPPHGWIRVQIHDADQQARDGKTYSTVALLCSLACLRAWAASITEVSV